MNGGAGLRFERLTAIDSTTVGWPGARRRGRSAVSASPMTGFSPSIRARSALNVAPPGATRSASIDQYSTAVNARISRSRSTTSRTATDWTRPADRPDRILREMQRAQRVADHPVDDPARLLRVDEVLVDRARVGERLADGRLGDLVEGHPAGRSGAGRWPRRRARRWPRPRDRGPSRDRPDRPRGRPSRSRPSCRLAVRRDLVGRSRNRARRRRRAGPCRGSRAGRGHVRTTRGPCSRTEIAFDRLRLGRRLDDDQIRAHDVRESSTGP